MIAQNDNPWRVLARELGLPSDGAIVRIPELQGPLLDPVRYGYDEGAFLPWFRAHFGGQAIEPRDVYPEWRFNHQTEPDGHSGFSAAGRNSFLCLYAKLRHEGLWPEVKSIRWVGETGEMTFFSHRSSTELQALLLQRGYGDWWMAGKDSPWGVRSGLRGAQLHFRGFSSDKDPDNVHIDLHNPGDPAVGQTSHALLELPGAVMHFVEDLNNRRASHQWKSLRAALEAQRVPLPPVVP